MLKAEDIARLERATVAGVAPRRRVELDGWVLGLDDGPMGRARSAAPLSHDPPPPLTPALAEAYAADGLPAAFRVPELASLAPVIRRLAEAGYRPSEPTWMMTAKSEAAAGFASLGSGAPWPVLLEAPDADWSATFCGPGFDPGEGARRVDQLSRSPGARFAAVRDGGRTLAVGVLSRAGGVGGIHGMRTAPDQRGRGHAGRILAAFARQASDWGHEDLILQVEAGNPARRLYRAAGFTELWRYWYWR
jgi:GNAT superfamily N-acetyltransferase